MLDHGGRESDDRAEENSRSGKPRHQIICLQELFRSQYFCREENPELFGLAEPIPGPSSDALAVLAKELGVVIIGSLFERRGLASTTTRPW